VCGPKVVDSAHMASAAACTLGEAAALSHISTDALHRGRLDGRADVVGNEAADRPCQRQILVAREHEADQPAHAGAEVVERVDGLLALQLRNQRHHVGRVHGT
jgi:hypothetical protein